uniref:Ankyrin repeat protein n=1 Tax=Trichogramma kaykai TaxID=54128 RepID=A0ABD2XR66_9HYME
MSTSNDEFDIILENRIKVDDIRSYQQDFDWEIEEERHEFFCQKLDPSIRDWKGQYPDLREIFRPEEIERLLTDSINYIKRGYFELGKRFIAFVAHSGYKDVLSSIDPPLHLALAGSHKQVAALLLRHGANPNLAIAAGSTPLHLICLSSDGDDLAKMLFELSDEKYLPVRVDAWSKFGNAPLHLALQSGKKKLAELLLRRDADPNLASKNGSTPLHLICERKYNDDVAELFFEISDEKHRSVWVDARDKNGWTPLQLAHLEKKGYELNESDALTIMKFFAKYGLFEKSVNHVQRWRQNKFGYEDKEMKKLIIIPDLSLYDLVRLKSEEAAKRLTFTDYYEFARSQPISGKDSGVHLIEKLSRGFFRHWALEFFAQLTHYELPIVCCKKIFDRLINEGLWHICLAATDQSS